MEKLAARLYLDKLQDKDFNQIHCQSQGTRAGPEKVTGQASPSAVAQHSYASNSRSGCICIPY